MATKAPAAVTAQFVTDLNRKFSADANTSMVRLSVIAGQRYDKIVRIDYNGGNGSVFAFVERTTGHLLKAAGWKAPAKGVRFHLHDLTSYDTAVSRADRNGSFLYAR